jgi:hypothetical protein
MFKMPFQYQPALSSATMLPRRHIVRVGQFYRMTDGTATALEELYRALYHEALGLDVTQAKDRAQDRPNRSGV